jgi:hypothetical protein
LKGFAVEITLLADKDGTASFVTDSPRATGSIPALRIVSPDLTGDYAPGEQIDFGFLGKIVASECIEKFVSEHLFSEEALMACYTFTHATLSPPPPPIERLARAVAWQRGRILKALRDELREHVWKPLASKDHLDAVDVEILNRILSRNIWEA